MVCLWQPHFFFAEEGETVEGEKVYHRTPDEYLHPLVTMILWPPFLPASTDGRVITAMATTTSAANKVILVTAILSR